MQHETTAALHRAAAQHLTVAHCLGQLDDFVHVAQLQLLKDVGEPHLFKAVIDHQPHRPFVAVTDEVDHGIVEPRVTHPGHGHQKLAFERHHCQRPCTPSAPS